MPRLVFIIVSVSMVAGCASTGAVPRPFPIPGGGTNSSTGGGWREPSSRGGWSPREDYPDRSGGGARLQDHPRVIAVVKKVGLP